MNSEETCFVCFKDIIVGKTENDDEFLGLVTAIVSDNPSRDYEIVLEYIRNNPTCNIFAWKCKGSEPVELK